MYLTRYPEVQTAAREEVEQVKINGVEDDEHDDIYDEDYGICNEDGGSL